MTEFAAGLGAALFLAAILIPFIPTARRNRK